jgi:hypothetical protein
MTSKQVKMIHSVCITHYTVKGKMVTLNILYTSSYADIYSFHLIQPLYYLLANYFNHNNKQLKYIFLMCSYKISIPLPVIDFTCCSYISKSGLCWPALDSTG